ncbi:hypothetical protein DM860_018039 [Cuscuta australis]|uniref:Pyridine nucleotide-disulphide oxidoreductase dimerisation domain-containing protein n=1 Tax=Cuscuta australis TaxID=267555 RepID=A0A328DYG9_9ASTE|nr:hypothetical protein DM860_018039 [Cuscuta australis]
MQKIASSRVRRLPSPPTPSPRQSSSIANHCLPPIPSRDLQSSSIPSASPVESSITGLANLPHRSQWNLPRQQKHLKGVVIPVESSIRSFRRSCSHLLRPLPVTVETESGFLLVVEQVSGRDHVLNHLSIPAARFTHPEISMVGQTELIYRPDNGEILGVHIIGLHAADLIHEASNAIALGTRTQVKVDTSSPASEPIAV